MRRDSRLASAGILILLLVLLISILNYLGRTQSGLAKEKVVDEGQPVVDSHFSHEREYIRYTIAGEGRLYWGDNVAQRFGITGEKREPWLKVARATIEGRGDKATSKEISELEYHLSPGTNLRIPIGWN